MSWQCQQECDGIAAWLPELDFELHAHLLEFCIVNNNAPTVQPFKYAKLVDHRQAEGYEVQELYEALARYLDEHRVNHGMILTWAGVLIFTEEELDINPLMFKLTTGTNIRASQEFNLSEWIKGNPILLKWFAGLVRE